MSDRLSYQAFRFACDNCIPFRQLETLLDAVMRTRVMMRASTRHPDDPGYGVLAADMMEIVDEIAKTIGFDGAEWNGMWPTLIKDGREIILPP
jgi:hypothetical protein